MAPTTDAEWTGEFAYAVGLIATDGNLSPDGKTVVQVSKDRDLLETFLMCLRTGRPITVNQGAFRVQICDVPFYDWLLRIGITPRKSLTLDSLRVPDSVFLDFVRGLMDGDGSVKNSLVVPNPRRYPAHTYQRLQVLFHSASNVHLDWLRAELCRRLGLRGWIGVRQRGRPSPLYVLRYSKHESIALLSALYADPSAPRLDRKWKRWEDFCTKSKPTRMWTGAPEWRNRFYAPASRAGGPQGP